MAKTSDRVSSIAARYINLTPERLLGMTAKPSTLEITTADIKALAASALRQDESPIRRLVKHIFGEKK